MNVPFWNWKIDVPYFHYSRAQEMMDRFEGVFLWYHLMQKNIKAEWNAHP